MNNELISKLKHINEFKNYNALCEFMGWKSTRGGNSRNAQFKELSCYCLWEKSGHRIIIKEVYDDLKSKIDNRKDSNIFLNINKGRFSKEMFPLVKSFVGKSELEVCSKGRIMKDLKLKNANYDIAYMYPKEFARYLKDKTNIDFTESDVNIISNAIYEHSNDKINKAFENLQKLGFISDYSNKYIMVYDEFRNHSKVATEYESEIIKKCLSISKREVLKNKMGAKNFIAIMKHFRDQNYSEDDIDTQLNIQIFLRGQNKKLKDDTLERIYLEGLDGVDNYYYAYGYIKNMDIDWRKEILDIAEETKLLANYKSQVRDSFLFDSFLEKMDEDSKHIFNKEVKKIHMKNNFNKYREVYIQKVEYLFDILVGDKPQFHITEDDMLEIGFKIKEEQKKKERIEKESIPF